MKSTESEDEKAALGSNKRLFWILGAAGVIAVLAGLFAPKDSRTHQEPLLGERTNLKLLGVELRAHAGANDGSFPASLEDLEIAGDSIGGSGILEFDHPNSDKSGSWAYYPGFRWDDRGETLLVASPSSFSESDGTKMVGKGQHRLALSLDQRIVILEEDDFQACIEEQKSPGWRKKRDAASGTPWSFLESPFWGAWRESRVESEHGMDDVPELLQLLKQGNKNERWYSSDALADMRPLMLELLPDFLDALGDPDAGYNAARALAVLSLVDHSVVPQMVEVLEKGDEVSKYWGTVGLGKIGLERAGSAIPAIVDSLEGEGDLPVSAAKAIAGAGSKGVGAVPQLIEMTRMGTSWDCKCAVIALGRIGPGAKEALPVLGEMYQQDHQYRMDVARAMWKIDASQATRLIPDLVAVIKAQRNPDGHNQAFDRDYFSAMELLGEIGPEAKVVIPLLKANLNGGAGLEAAWALWRIDPTEADLVTPVLAGFLESSVGREDRLDRLAKNSQRSPQLESFNHSFTRRLAAFGALWQMHPEKRPDLRPVLLALLHEWEAQKVLKALNAETRAAVPALEELAGSTPDQDLKLLANEALQLIKSTDQVD